MPLLLSALALALGAHGIEVQSPNMDTHPHVHVESSLLFGKAIEAYPSVSRIVLFMMTQNGDPRVWAYLFEPLFSTLRFGLVDLVSSTAPSSSYVVISAVINDRSTEPVAASLLTLGAGDMYVHVGPMGRRRIDFRQMHANGVYIVYYQTEPRKFCQTENRDVHERWEYSLATVRLCENASWFSKPTGQPGGRKVRYIPAGALNTARAAYRDGPQPLVFLGGGGPDRARCLNSIRRQIGASNLTLLGGMWDDRNWGNHLLHANALYLNIHKSCGRSDVPIEPRVAKLINAHALVVTEPSDLDSDYIAGLPSVFVAPVQSMGAVYRTVAAMSASKRSALAARSFAIFSARSAPAAIMADAGVPALIDGLVVAKARALREHSVRPEPSGPRGQALARKAEGDGLLAAMPASGHSHKTKRRVIQAGTSNTYRID
jgi:hypothetical protein